MPGRTYPDWAMLDAALAELLRQGDVSSLTQAAKILDVSLPTLRGHLRDAWGIGTTAALLEEYVQRHEAKTAETAASPFEGELEPGETRIQHQANGNIIIETLLAITEEEAKSPRRVLELLKYDPALWRVLQVDIGFWTGQRSHKLGGGQEPLQAVKAKIAPLVVSGVPLADVLDSITARLEAGIPAAPKLKRSKPTGKLIAEFPQTDHHLGSDPAQGEYNAEEVIAGGQAEILDRLAKCDGLGKIVLPVIGDILHYDTKGRTTTGGTPLTSSMGPHEMIDLGVTLMTRLVEKCATIAPVEVIYIPGNHDYLLGYTLMVALQAHFRHDPKHITFDLDKQSRKWRRWGVNMVGWEHGELPKSRAMNWLAVEAQSEWSQALYKEIHSGHFHSRRMAEEGGVIHQNLPSPAPTDTWHYEKGFVGASRGFMAFVWDPNRPGWREQHFAEVNAM